MTEELNWDLLSTALPTRYVARITNSRLQIASRTI